MGGIELQDVFDPYYAGRKNPMPHEQVAKDKDANREEMEHQLADRAKPARKLKPAKPNKMVGVPSATPRET